MPDSELERIGIGLRESEDKRRWRQLRKAVETERDVDPGELTRPTIFTEAAEAYLTLARLRNDKRVQRALEDMARRHGVEESEISLEALAKTIAGEYVGFAQTEDWQREEGEVAP